MEKEVPKKKKTAQGIKSASKEATDSLKEKKISSEEKAEGEENTKEEIKEVTQEEVQEERLEQNQEVPVEPEKPANEEEEPQEPVAEKRFFSLEEKNKLLAKTGINPLIILIAFAFLAGVGFFVWKNLSGSGNQILPAANLNSYDPVTKEPVSFNLELTNPDDEQTFFDKSIIISGKTSPKTSIIIDDNGDYSATEADNNGEFSQVIVLDLGINNILVHGVDQQGNTKTERRIIYYSADTL